MRAVAKSNGRHVKERERGTARTVSEVLESLASLIRAVSALLTALGQLLS